MKRAIEAPSTRLGWDMFLRLTVFMVLVTAGMTAFAQGLKVQGNSQIQIRNKGRQGVVTLSPLKMTSLQNHQIYRYGYIIMKSRPEWVQMISFLCSGEQLVAHQFLQSNMPHGNSDLTFKSISGDAATSLKEIFPKSVFAAFDTTWNSRVLNNPNSVCSSQFVSDFSHLTLESMTTSRRYNNEMTRFTFDPQKQVFNFSWGQTKK
ncbi:MAG: hypothetical protein AB7O96_14450 [Pseudobdellovibrionaceae bacterium]